MQDLVEGGMLSGLQLESIVYACQRHEQLLPRGVRCGFFIGDGEPTQQSTYSIMEKARQLKCSWSAAQTPCRLDAP